MIQRVWECQRDEWRSVGRFVANNHIKVNKWQHDLRGYRTKVHQIFTQCICIIAAVHPAGDIFQFAMERLRRKERLKPASINVHRLSAKWTGYHSNVPWTISKRTYRLIILTIVTTNDGYLVKIGPVFSEIIRQFLPFFRISRPIKMSKRPLSYNSISLSITRPRHSGQNYSN